MVVPVDAVVELVSGPVRPRHPEGREPESDAPRGGYCYNPAEAVQSDPHEVQRFLRGSLGALS